MTQSTIIAGFVKTGICPFRPVAVAPEPPVVAKRPAKSRKERVENRKCAVLFNGLQVEYRNVPTEAPTEKTPAFIPPHGALITTPQKLQEKEELERRQGPKPKAYIPHFTRVGLHAELIEEEGGKPFFVIFIQYK